MYKKVYIERTNITRFVPRPQNPLRNNTPVMITKVLKNEMRTYAIPSAKRKGNETDAEILERVFIFFKQHHNPTNTEPVTTYTK